MTCTHLDCCNDADYVVEWDGKLIHNNCYVCESHRKFLLAKAAEMNLEVELREIDGGC